MSDQKKIEAERKRREKVERDDQRRIIADWARRGLDEAKRKLK